MVFDSWVMILEMTEYHQQHVDSQRSVGTLKTLETLGNVIKPL